MSYSKIFVQGVKKGSSGPNSCFHLMLAQADERNEIHLNSVNTYTNVLDPSYGFSSAINNLIIACSVFRRFWNLIECV